MFCELVTQMTPTYADLLAEVALLKEQSVRKDVRIAYLDRLLYGVKSDLMAPKVPLIDRAVREVLWQIP